MLNIIRADFYRVIRSKGIYITFAILLIFTVFSIGIVHFIQSGDINVVEMGGDAVMVDFGEFDLSGHNTPMTLATSLGSDIMWFMLPFIVIIGAAMFSHNTVKNDIAWGLCRVKLYMAKLLLTSAFCALMMLFYYGLGMLIGTVLNGFGSPEAGHWVHMLQVFGAQLFLMLGVTSVGMFLVFTTRRTAATIGIFIAFFLVPMFILQMLVFANPDFMRFTGFDLSFNINSLAGIRYLETYEIVRAFGLGAFYLFGGTTLGIILFRRAEIK